MTILLQPNFHSKLRLLCKLLIFLSLSPVPGFVRIRLLKVEDRPSVPADTFPIEITHQMDLPSDDTTYWCSVHKLPQQLQKKHHVIQVSRGRLNLVEKTFEK